MPLSHLTSHEIELLRGLLHIKIMSQKAGQYTVFNQIAKKVDEFLEVAVGNV